MFPRAHGTPTMKGKGMGMETDDLLCSRNARLKKALVGRAQWKINQAPSPKEVTSKLGRNIMKMCSFDARSKGQSWPLPLRLV